MAKRREFMVLTDFNTRHEMVRKETFSMREALRDASARAKRGIRAHVVERGARGQSFIAECSPRDAGGYAPADEAPRVDLRSSTGASTRRRSRP